MASDSVSQAYYFRCLKRRKSWFLLIKKSTPEEQTLSCLAFSFSGLRFGIMP